MDRETIETLSNLNRDFYRANCASFSETRQHAWPGWERVVRSMAHMPSSVLDVACGNMRFKTFLEAAYEGQSFRYHAVDSCPSLLPESPVASFQDLDIVKALMKDSFDSDVLAPPCALTVCFGFMHHVPTGGLRRALIEGLANKTESGGVLAVSLWRFASDEAMREKAQESTERGCAQMGLSLEKGDYLLGWQGLPNVYRYCHSFSDEEIDSLVESVSSFTCVVDRFKADGRTGLLNEYLVFRMNG